MKKSAPFFAVAATILLVGCSDKGADRNGDGKISDSEVEAEMAQGGALPMKPGQWEMKTVVDDIKVSDMDSTQEQLVRGRLSASPAIKTCITKAQADNPGGDVIGSTPGSDCTVQSLNRSGNSISLVKTCRTGDDMSAETKLDGAFAAESYSLAMEQKSKLSIGTVETKGRLEARRIGDCPG